MELFQSKTKWPLSSTALSSTAELPRREGRQNVSKKMWHMVIVGTLATPSYIEVSANRTSTSHDFRILFAPQVVFEGKIASHSASTVVMAVFSESDFSQAASKVCKKLLQFRSDRGGWGKIAPVFWLVYKCRARTTYKNIAARHLVQQTSKVLLGVTFAMRPMM